MNNIFIIESPLQLINAIEAREHFKSENIKNTLIVFEGVSSKNLDQIKSLVVIQEWDLFFTINKTNNRWNYSRPIRLLNSIIKKSPEVNCIFIGEYRSILMRHVANYARPKNIFLLDDGNFSLYIQKRLLDGIKEYNRYNLIRKAYDRMLKIRDQDILSINFFSVYEHNISSENRHRFIPNRYSFLKSKIRKKNKSNEVYMLGSITPEMNIFSLGYYMSTLKGAISFYKKRNLNVIYVPHRRENQDKLLKIKNDFKIEVRNYDLPIEQVLIFEEILPSKVSCFFSSALDNCYFLFGESIQIDSFQIDHNEILIEQYKERIKLNYEVYATYNPNIFNIINIIEYYVK
ncbi:hypothetical protein [Reichenbachiella sp.]